MPSHEIHEGDALAILRTLPSDHYHGSLTDPPYGLSFMGHAWDHGVPSVEVWAEVLRCLRPGAHLLAFGGTRTFHRLACAIEDAGFEIRDCMQWLYASGYPKSHDVSKAIDKSAGATREVVGHRKLTGTARIVGGQGGATSGRAGAMYETHELRDTLELTAPATEAARQWSGYGTALKPAWEPIIVARKPLDGTVAENVQRWGCGGLAIDACRVGTSKDVPASAPKSVALSVAMGASRDPGTGTGFDPTLGRWPANVILDEEAGAMLDAQTWHLAGRGNKGPCLTSKAKRVAFGQYGPSDCGERFSHGDSGGASRFFQSCDFSTGEVEAGSASRFIYCPKASRSERDAGLEEFELAANGRQFGTIQNTPNPPQRNIHPTVKPIALARYLARLILPPIPDARMLTPFSGSGSEVIGALQAGWSHVDGIDSWDVAVRISRARIAHWSEKLSGPVQLDLTGE